ncbi:putative esterase [Golovinomyces cichoracearum]|uniref:alcohol O-acetyltransferase n=1 Tax=Golovinomyces cichoracearum TaxID=62708 RepID=A0A420IQI5_9PEZI|nr:putative esterase [Golovinomyces cichoracearum]
MEWLGSARTRFTHSLDTLKLTRKDGEETNLLTICQDSTPPCRLNPLLFNGHLQTMWTTVKKDGPAIHYKRKIFESNDPCFPGSFAVDFVKESSSETDDSLPPRTTYFSDQEFEEMTLESDDSRPMLVVLHGLTGGSYEIYLKHVLEPLVNTDGDRRWEACVVNSRGCAHHKISSSLLYNARATWDCRQTVSWLKKTFPNRPLFGVGFSLGANILVNYIGEEGPACVFKAAVVISNPWALEIGSVALQRTWMGREIYSKTMGANLRRLIELHHDQLSKNPFLDLEKIRKSVYIHEFDRLVQGPTWGYPTEGSYYRDASSADSLLAVRIPLFAINAEDDPIVTNEAVPYEEVKQTPNVVLCTTSLGGHLSWYEIGGLQWHARPTINFLNKMAFEVISESSNDSSSSISEIKRSFVKRFDPMCRKWRVMGDEGNKCN